MVSISLTLQILKEQLDIALQCSDTPEAERIIQAIADLEGIKDYIKQLGGKV